METTKERHGFVTFWLWLGIVGCLFSVLVNMYNKMQDYFRICNHLSSINIKFGLLGINNDISSIRTGFIYLYIYMILDAIFLIIGYAQLLKWKKSGFWILVGTRILSIVLVDAVFSYINKNTPFPIYDTSLFMEIITIVGVIFSMGLLFAILHIRKNGVSCWKQLE